MVCGSSAQVVAFIVGSVTSILCGYIGMRIAVYSNTRTAHEAWKSLSAGYDVAIRGGCVMGLSLVSMGVLSLYGLIVFYKSSSHYLKQFWKRNPPQVFSS